MLRIRTALGRFRPVAWFALSAASLGVLPTALIVLMTDAASAWIDEHIDDPQFYCNALIVESRYARDIIAAMKQYGLVVV